ncbi:hypothetical protein BIV23_37235 [Streptomyces monashensis]|uniref:DUF6545 domain-containing protein n=1 Tax=Streptomyces monashensis TaxID=1678012 RepID=A0A1S2PII4_9ACTN|nr:DUF6545 domain-containing protein [Streptomyces monashensis]OIJ93598.1 hypothetical protein BIV23_37235 [Streptomyces monashensis]
MLLTGRKTALYDAILALTPYCDSAVREFAYRSALRNGDDETHAAVTADAAMLLIARDRQRTGTEQLQETTRIPAHRVRDLFPLSLALTSPVLPNLLNQLGTPKKAAHHE